MGAQPGDLGVVERLVGETQRTATLYKAVLRYVERSRCPALRGFFAQRPEARKLSLSPRTVEMHVANALLALQCHTRAEAVRRATELKLID